MPKRKRSVNLESEMELLMKKVKKLKRKMRKQSSSDSDNDSRENDSLRRDSTPRMQSEIHKPDMPHTNCESNEWILESPEHCQQDDLHSSDLFLADNFQDIPASSSTTEIDKTASTLALEITAQDEFQELDTDALEILGDDPVIQIKYGKDIRSELASRLQHLSQEGLNKDTKKTLIAKYPLPANCIYIGAPKLNPEIKAALADIALKRDKAIEAKQVQLASALACLGEIVNSQLNSKERDNELLQKLMDTTRLLCDIQHNDSTTRKHFVMSSLKKDMKDHLTCTKIDSFLFGENLAETLKSAKAVSKSGQELKADGQNQTKKSNTSVPKNQRAPAPMRRQPVASPRSRGPAIQRAVAPPPQQTYYRTAWQAPPPPPPPPRPPMARRRY